MRNSRLKNKIILSISSKPGNKFRRSDPNPELSICITVKNRSSIRYENKILKLFPNCIDSIKNSIDKANTEIIVTDWHSTDINMDKFLSSKLMGYNYKLVSMEEKQFSRGAGLNKAAENSSGSIILFLDADVTITKQAIKDVIEFTSKTQSYFPRVLLFQDPNHKTKRFTKRGYGNCSVHRNNLVKWWSKQSWGHEDTDFYKRIKSDKIRHKTTEFKHQWHPIYLKFKHYQQ